MILIEDILVSDEIIENNFVCNLNACKGACCIEGDFGAPLEEEELSKIDSNLSHILKYLPKASQKEIAKNGWYTKGEYQYETGLMKDGACVFMNTNAIGIHYCGIEKAHREGKSDFLKPISCHLYPIRVQKNEVTGFEALNYDRWDICNPACANGDKLQIPIYKFAKNAIVRKYGESFYEALDGAAQYSAGDSEE